MNPGRTATPPSPRTKPSQGFGKGIAAGRSVCQGCDGGVWWPLRILGRLWFGVVVITSPFRALAMVLDIAVSACLLSVFAALAAWWVGWIPDERVAAVLAELGERVLAILGRSGLLP